MYESLELDDRTANTDSDYRAFNDNDGDTTNNDGDDDDNEDDVDDGSTIGYLFEEKDGKGGNEQDKGKDKHKAKAKKRRISRKARMSTFEVF